MKAERRSPCGNCPFRKDAPLAHWHPEEYLMLHDIECTEGETTRRFGCHKDGHKEPEERELCVGWMIYQRDKKPNGVESLGLRVLLATQPEVLAQFNEATSYVEVYDTIDELVRVNLAADQKKHPDRYER